MRKIILKEFWDHLANFDSCPFNCLSFSLMVNPYSFWNPTPVDSFKYLCSHFTQLKLITPNHLVLLKRGISLKYLYLRIGDGNFLSLSFFFLLPHHLSRYWVFAVSQELNTDKFCSVPITNHDSIFPLLVMKKLSHDCFTRFISPSSYKHGLNHLLKKE